MGSRNSVLGRFFLNLGGECFDDESMQGLIGLNGFVLQSLVQTVFHLEREGFASLLFYLFHAYQGNLTNLSKSRAVTPNNSLKGDGPDGNRT